MFRRSHSIFHHQIAQQARAPVDAGRFRQLERDAIPVQDPFCNEFPQSFLELIEGSRFVLWGSISFRQGRYLRSAE
jgi:hypothetical protein